jgi:hypothetical protein
MVAHFRVNTLRCSGKKARAIKVRLTSARGANTEGAARPYDEKIQQVRQ